MVSPSSANVTKASAFSTVYANLQYNTAGTEWTNSVATTDNFSSSRGDWLDSGSSSDVWVERTINSGSYWVDAGSGRLNLGTTRSWKVRDTNSSPTTAVCNADYDFYDAASGGSNIGSVNVVLTADYESAGCPFCCFPPGTKIAMQSGIELPIEAVRSGDQLWSEQGPMEVEEIVVRHQVPVYRLTFSDGRTLDITPDHPVLTDLGPASILGIDYKDLDSIRQLEIGDRVYAKGPQWLVLEDMQKLGVYPTVYTFSNSNFYAGGILVF